MENLLARLHPYDKRLGHTLKTYTYRGTVFNAGSWYRVPADIGAYLKGVHSRQEDPTSPPAFTVCSEQDANELVEQEDRAAQASKKPDTALVTKDLTVDEAPEKPRAPGAPSRRQFKRNK